MVQKTSTVKKNPHNSAGSIKALLKQLGELAARPLSEATSMPKQVYLSDEFNRLEQEKIFDQEWICAGRTDDVPNPGDYRTFQLGKQPLVIIRQKDGSIEALSNVCLHRMMQIVEGRGNAKKMVCPYHAWTYGIDGQLKAAPHMDKSSCFDKGHHKLPNIRLEIWCGWIYVTLNAKAEPINKRLSKFDEVAARYRMEDFVGIVSEDHVWNTNWKLLAENFMEGYHLPIAHKATVGGFIDVNNTSYDERGPFDFFSYQSFTKSEDATVGTAHPKNTTLKDEWRYTSLLPVIYPSHLIVLAPDHLWYLSLQPQGTGQVRMRYGASIAPEVLENHPNPDELIDSVKDLLDRVNDEDRFLVEGIFRGANAPMSTSGPLSWLEQQNHEFTQYLSRMIS